jgi:hypothetical protein
MEKIVDDISKPITPADPADDGWKWGIFEIMGHRTHAGRFREEEMFGSKMLRIDIPVNGDAAVNGWETVYYGGSSIFSFRLCDEAAAVKVNKPYDPATSYRITARDDIEDDESPF